LVTKVGKITSEMSSNFSSPRLAAKRKREEAQLDFKTKDVKIAEAQYNQRFTKEQIEKLATYDLSEDIKDFVEIAENVGTSTSRVQRWFQKQKYKIKKAEEKSQSSDTENSGNDSEENEDVESEEVEEIENHFEQRDLNQSKGGSYRKGMKYNTLSEDQKDKLKTFFEESDRFTDNEDEICEEVGISAERGRKWFCNHRYYIKYKPQIIKKYHPRSDCSRAHLNYKQKEKLIAYFNEDCVLGERKTDIAHDIDIPESRVMSWWQRHTSKNGLAGFKKRKTYELFSKEERDLLKTYFDEDYDLGDRQYSIADELGVSVARITVWWSNRASFLRRKGVDIPKTPTRPYAKLLSLPTTSLNSYSGGSPTKIGDEHKALLSKYFSHDPNPSLEQREEISEKTGLSYAQVYMWFYWKRKRDGIESVSSRKTVGNSPQGEKEPLNESYGSTDNQLVVDDRRENHKRMTMEQMVELEKLFCADDPSPLADKDERRTIGNGLGLNERQVYQWYYRRVRQSDTKMIPSDRPKRWTTEKFIPLRKEYDINPIGVRFTTKSGRKEIAKELGYTEQQVYMWYYNRAKKDGHRIPEPCNRFKDWQKEILKQHFQIDQNPLGTDLKKLISRTKLRRRQVYHWFREERRRRENKEAPELDFWQEEILEGFFEINNHPSVDDRTKLGYDTELNERKVNAWFKNRRNAQEISNTNGDESDEGDDGSEIEDNESHQDIDKDNRAAMIEVKVENSESGSDDYYVSDEIEVPIEKGHIEDWQKMILFAHWKTTQNPPGQLLNKIMKQTKLKIVQIHHWFRQERNRLKEETKESPSQNLKSVFTINQKEILNDAFELTKYPCQGEKNKLLRETGLSPNQLKWWFVTRRRQSKCLNTKFKETEQSYKLDLKKWQTKVLRDSYETDHYPLGKCLTDIADNVKLTREQVYHWFKARRPLDEEEHFEDELRTSSSRRLPVKFTEDQWEILADYYENTNAYPTRSELKALAEKVDATRLRVKWWFVDRRRTKPINSKHRFNQSPNLNVYPLLILDRVDCSQLNDQFLDSVNSAELETMPKKLSEVVNSETLPESESDIDSNLGFSCEYIKKPKPLFPGGCFPTLHSESDSEPINDEFSPQKLTEPEFDIDSNLGFSCEPKDTLHFECDSEPINEPESNTDETVSKLSPQKLQKSTNESSGASKSAAPRSIDPDGKLSKFFERNQYPKRTHIVDLANRISATEEQVRIWFQNRRRRELIRTGKPCKRISCRDSESELSDDHDTVLIPPTPINESSDDVSDGGQSRIPVVKSDIKSSDPDLKMKKNSKWKVMKHLDDIQFIQNFYVCDLCELSFIFQENLSCHQCDEIVM